MMANTPLNPKVMGADPGNTGAVAIIQATPTLNDNTYRILAMIDMPTYKISTRSRKCGYKTRLDVFDLVHQLEIMANTHEVALCALESPAARPKQGLSSTFDFGRSCGQVHGVIASQHIPVVPVKPNVWKPSLGLTQNKRDSIKFANQLFPCDKARWALVKHNDRAEAALLAYYAIRHLPHLIRQASLLLD